MPGEHTTARPGEVCFLYEGWMIWDGHYGPARVGEEFVASLEFAQFSQVRTVPDESPLGIDHLAKSRYRVVGEVLDTTDAVVLDLGAFRALRWVRPGEDAEDFTAGAVVALELSLAVNAWAGSPWSDRADELYGTEHRWKVTRIVRSTHQQNDATELDVASMETVDSAVQHCILTCRTVP